MDNHIVYWIVFVFTMFSLVLVYLLLIWNKKNISSKEKLAEAEKNKQRDLLKASISGQELERKRIAENLHDDVGPLLSALKLQLSMLDIKKESFSEITDTLNYAVDNLRNVSSSMSPAILEELGLSQAIHYIEHRFKKYSDINLVIEWDEDIEKLLEADEEINLYRIVQEAMSNAIKHSKAKNLEIVGKLKESNLIEVYIKDDGIGFDNSDVSATNGLGLKNMQARAETLNGMLMVNTSDEGTNIFLQINRI